MAIKNPFRVQFASRGRGVGPFPEGTVEFRPGASAVLTADSGGPKPKSLTGTYSDLGDCRIAIFTRENGEHLGKPLMMKGLLMQEAESPIFVGGFWWHETSDTVPTIPPDDIGSWTATSGGNTGGEDG